MHCHTAFGHWAVELLQCTATLLQGSGQINSCNAPQHCPGAVGSGTRAMHCPRHCAAELVHFSATLLADSARWNSHHPPSHCLWSVGGGTPAMHRHTACGPWTVGTHAMHCHSAGGHAMGLQTHAIHRHTAWGQWALALMQSNRTLFVGVGRWNSCNAPRDLRRQWVVELLQCTATLLGGSGHWKSCNPPPPCLSAVGGGTPAMHCHSACVKR